MKCREYCITHNCDQLTLILIIKIRHCVPQIAQPVYPPSVEQMLDQDHLLFPGQILF